MGGVWTRTLCKLLGRIDIEESANVLCPKTNRKSAYLVNLTMLWNQQMRHIGEKGDHVVHNKVIVEGLPLGYEEVNLREHFIYGKHTICKVLIW